MDGKVDGRARVGTEVAGWADKALRKFFDLRHWTVAWKWGALNIKTDPHLSESVGCGSELNI